MLPARLPIALAITALTGCAVLASAACATPTTAAADTSDDVAVVPPATAFGALLARARDRAALPAVAGVVVTTDGPATAHAFGRRRADRAGAADTVTAADRFHLGSNTKAITATLLGALVEDGVLRWDRTLAESFPELGDAMTPAYRAVTLRQLLTHRGGVPAFTSPAEILGAPAAARGGGTPAEQRRALADWLLRRPTAVAPGTFAYSNAGYALAAAIAERATGRDWETLLRTRLLAPLGVPDAAVRVGWPGLGAAAAPWGHVEVGAGRYEAHDPADGRVIAIPGALAPAGDLAMTMDAYARVLRLHLEGLAGRDGVVKAETIRALHVADGDYASGWGVGNVGGATAHFHEGSAGTFHAVTVLVPSRGIAVATVTNAGGERAAAAVREAALAAVGPAATQAAAAPAGR